jgi:hypothetical protein
MNSAALDNPYLDTIISLVLVYALLSILVSVLLEAWNKRTKERGVFLQKVILRLLDDPLNKNYGYLIYQHPIINKMRKDENSFPHYIPAEGFANALIDTLAEGGVTMKTQALLGGNDVTGKLASLSPEERALVEFVTVMGDQMPLAMRLEGGVKRMKESELKRLLMNFLDRNRKEAPSAGGASTQTLPIDLDRLKKELGRWFDDNMERASGEFKNDQRRKLVLLGFLVAIVLNVDSLHLAKVFLLDKDLRASMVAEAERVADNYEQMTRQATDSLTTALMVEIVRDTAVLSNGQRTTSKLQERVVDLALDDSVYNKQAEEVLLMVRSWQLPIGWNPGEAPWSWVDGRKLKVIPKEFKPSQRAVLEHFKRRNTFNWTNLFKWLIGISITGYTLSLGAPFWFETLVKLVNLRRSGGKPKTTDERNSNQQ